MWEKNIVLNTEAKIRAYTWVRNNIIYQLEQGWYPKLLDIRCGICSLLYKYATGISPDFEYKDMFSVFPELLQHKPYDKPTGGYWWDRDRAGYNERVAVLNSIIEELNKEIILTKKERLECYTAVLQQITSDNSDGICNRLMWYVVQGGLLRTERKYTKAKKHIMSNDLNVHDLFPELIEYKPPKQKKNDYWWTFAPQGNTRRRRVLQLIINELTLTL